MAMLFLMLASKATITVLVFNNALRMLQFKSQSIKIRKELYIGITQESSMEF